MITVWGGQTSRSIRVVWVMEEMGLPYRLRQVNMLARQKDPEFLAVNPANYIPALQDGGVVMIESIAIMEYLMARYGPTPLAPAPHEPNFPAYQQFLHMGEAGLATLMMPVVVSRLMAPEDERENWGASWCRQSLQKRLTLIGQRLATSPAPWAVTPTNAQWSGHTRGWKPDPASPLRFLDIASSITGDQPSAAGTPFYRPDRSAVSTMISNAASGTTSACGTMTRSRQAPVSRGTRTGRGITCFVRPVHALCRPEFQGTRADNRGTADRRTRCWLV